MKFGIYDFHIADILAEACNEPPREDMAETRPGLGQHSPVAWTPWVSFSTKSPSHNTDPLVHRKLPISKSTYFVRI